MSNATASQLEKDSAMTLSQASVGCDFTIKVVDGPQCDRLRDLGFCESLQVRKLANGRNLICSVCGTRLAISRELADQVKVSPI
ncbi:MAG: ferrous iron transport protein A [Verrucomicrobiales bacterium]|jgi:ferrous iron transport protein A